jgi:hypothetical protein
MMEEMLNANGSCGTAIAPSAMVMRVNILLMFGRNREWDAEMLHGHLIAD